MLQQSTPVLQLIYEGLQLLFETANMEEDYEKACRAHDLLETIEAELKKRI